MEAAKSLEAQAPEFAWHHFFHIPLFNASQNTCLNSTKNLRPPNNLPYHTYLRACGAYGLKLSLLF